MAPLAEKGARGKGRQPLSPPQYTVARSANCTDPSHRHYWMWRSGEELGDRRAGAVVERVGDLDRPADWAHVFLLPIDAEGLVDGGVEVAHGDHALGDVGA